MKDIAQKQLQRIADYQRAFTEDHGKRVLQDLMEQHGMLQSTFDPNPYEMARKEGERNVILRILQLMDTDVVQLKALIDERIRNA